MDRRVHKLAAATLSASVVIALTTTSSATASDDVDVAELATPEMLAAAERDLDLSRQEAIEVFASDLQAMHTQERLEKTLDESEVGAWIDDGELVVAVSDRRAAADVRRAGATPRLVEHSTDELSDVVSTLDDAEAPDASEVYSWYVDVPANTVVVEAAEGAHDAATEWLAETGVDADLVEVETTETVPEPFYDVVGGTAYDVPGSGCSVGFAVQPRGFVTAGHCGNVGTPTTGYNGASQGVFERSVFPGSDGAYVSVNQNWSVTSQVSRWNGTYAQVNGSDVAPIGATTCRSGRTSGYRCGQIEAYNQTVNYSQGPVRGLTRTSACARPGDSGGSFIAAGINAQGVTSGGSGFCGSGGRPQTYFQPVNPMLNAWNLTLVTQ
ncbi:S1 family peptidase [Actinobacteria bacterium YIM 96077]|uniref:S1 family peptidase n=1 Tax=Phytoactinopolyspora halophila TaxID=1981511 RepID=A0A329R3T4_9ACTN|nr:S1 family peptidase [Phytoactinopolyspora halophila]AYY12057.1 S1 family peptidase [Actinobacteria bacterium YIM 96077]RAW18709.1 S1 family peptidase [Phytoactinopolyspora halophila]